MFAKVLRTRIGSLYGVQVDRTGNWSRFVHLFFLDLACEGMMTTYQHLKLTNFFPDSAKLFLAPPPSGHCTTANGLLNRRNMALPRDRLASKQHVLVPFPFPALHRRSSSTKPLVIQDTVLQSPLITSLISYR